MKGGVFRTTLNEQAVNLDNFSSMNASLAKAPFTEKTISEIMSHCAKVIRVKLNYEDKETLTGERLKKILAELKQKCEALEVVTTENATMAKCAITIRSDIAYLEFCVAVHRVYNQRFMNSSWKITLANIESEEAELKDALTYFEDWRVAASAYMKDEDNSVTTRARGRFCLSPKTLKNM
jgi:hypothetical protein